MSVTPQAPRHHVRVLTDLAESLAVAAGIDPPIVVMAGGDEGFTVEPEAGRAVVVIAAGSLDSKIGALGREVACLAEGRWGPLGLVRMVGTIAGAGITAWGLMSAVTASGSAAWGGLVLAGLGGVLWLAVRRVMDHVEDVHADRRGAALLRVATAGDDGRGYVADAIQEALDAPTTSWWDRLLLRHRRALATK